MILRIRILKKKKLTKMIKRIKIKKKIIKMF